MSVFKNNKKLNLNFNKLWWTCVLLHFKIIASYLSNIEFNRLKLDRFVRRILQGERHGGKRSVHERNIFVESRHGQKAEGHQQQRTIRAVWVWRELQAIEYRLKCLFCFKIIFFDLSRRPSWTLIKNAHGKKIIIIIQFSMGQ